MKKISLFSPFLTKKQIRFRLSIHIIIFILYQIIVIILLNWLKNVQVFALNIVPIFMGGLLLGKIYPVLITIIVTLIPYFLTYVLGIHNTGTLFSGTLINLVMAVFGVTTGWVIDLTITTNETAKQLQIAKDQADLANKSKSEFLANISHEIRTPMNSITGFAEMLKDNEKDVNRIEKLDIIIKSGNYLLSLINDLLDFSRIEAGESELKKSSFTFQSLFAPIINIFSLKAVEKHIDFQVQLDTDLPVMVYGDERRILQIVINFVSNAIKFTRSGGVNITCSYNNGKVLIVVSDTGIGIPLDKQRVIFEAFKQVNPSLTREGVGLGLAISKRLAEQMGGSISLYSKSGEGSSFRVEIPLPVVLPSENENFYTADNTSVVKSALNNPDAIPGKFPANPLPKPFQLDDESKKELKNIIEVLRYNCRIFKPKEIKLQVENLKKVIPEQFFSPVSSKITASINNYDDALLMEAVNHLEKYL